MKNCFSWIGRSIVLGGLMAISVGVGGAIAANDNKNPTDAEIQKFRADVKRDIQKNGLPRLRKRNAEDQAFVNSWKEVNPEAIPFLGGWNAQGESFNIYPSTKRGYVCLFYTFAGSHDFTKGKVDKDLIKLENGYVYLIEQGSLVPFEREFTRPVYNSPTLMFKLESLDPKDDHTRSDGPRTEDVKKMAREAGCQSTSPVLNQVSKDNRESTIESLPDGNYHYKYRSNREMLLFSFRKNGNMIAVSEGFLPELDHCILGQVKDNSIVKGVEYTQGYGRSEKSTFSLITSPRDLSKMTPLTLRDAESASFPVSGWLRSTLNSDPLSLCKDTVSLLMDRFVAAYGNPISTSISQQEKTIAPQPTASPTPISPPQPVTSRPPNAQETALLDRTIRDSKAPNLSRNQSIDRQTLQSKSSW